MYKLPNLLEHNDQFVFLMAETSLEPGNGVTVVNILIEYHGMYLKSVCLLY
jgi:hypothetical protein